MCAIGGLLFIYYVTIFSILNLFIHILLFVLCSI